MPHRGGKVEVIPSENRRNARGKLEANNTERGGAATCTAMQAGNGDRYFFVSFMWFG